MADVQSDGRLNWRSTLDNSDFKKKSKENIDLIRQQLEAAGDTTGLKAYDAAIANTSAKEVKARKAATDSIDKQAQALEKLAAKQAAMKAKTDFSTAEDSKQFLGSVASSGQPGQNGFDSLSRVVKQSLKDVQKATDEATRAYKDGSISLEDYQAKMNKLFLEETEELALLEKLKRVKQEDAQVTAQQTQEAVRETGAIERLKEQIKQLNQQKSQSNAAGLPAINQSLRDANTELSRLQNLGVEKPIIPPAAIEKPTGLINRLTYAQKLYGDMVKSSTNPDIISKYNKKLEETQQQVSRLSNVGKTGFDELGNKIEKANGFASRFGNTLKSILASYGIIFIINKFIELATSIKDVAVEASGVDRAFSRLADNRGLEKLRSQVGGFVADLDLERLTVKANNFNIPLEKLGGFLNFAQQRAKATGEDVNKLTENIIDGLGRKSSRIIDNLGISIIEIQKEFAKTGDFTIAVSNLIAAKSEEAGTHVDTLADKVNKMGVSWDNAKKSVGGFFARIFNTDTPEDSIIGQQTQILKNYIGLTRDSVNEVTKFQKQSQEKRQQDLIEQGKLVQELAFKYKVASSSINDPTAFGYADQKEKRDKIVKDLGRRLEVEKNIQVTMQEQANQQDKIERTSKNILSLAEMQEREAKLRTEAVNIIPGINGTEKERADLFKQANDLKDQIDAITGKYAKRDARRAESLLNQQIAAANSLKAAQTSELNSIEDLKEKYHRNTLQNADEEKQAIIDNFKKQKDNIDALNLKYDNYVKKFGQSAANKQGLKKIDSAFLTPLEQQAIDDLESERTVIKSKETAEQQKVIYKEYRDYMIQYSAETAKMMFGDELRGYTSYVKFIQGELKKLGNTPGDNKLRDFYEKELPKAIRQESDDNFQYVFQNINRLVDVTNTVATKRKLIEEQYQKDILMLAFNYNAKDSEERIKELKRQKQDALSAAGEEGLHKLEAYRELTGAIDRLSSDEIQKNIDAVQKYVDTVGGLNKDVVANIKKLLSSSSSVIEHNFTDKVRGIGSVFNSIGSGLAGANDSASKLLINAGNLVTAFANIKDSIATLNDKNASSSDKFAAGTSFVSSAWGLIDNFFVKPLQQIGIDQEIQRRSVITAQVNSATALNKALERQLELTKQLYGGDRLSGYIKQLNDIKDAQNTINNQLDKKVSLPVDKNGGVYSADKNLTDLINTYNNDPNRKFNGKDVIDKFLANGGLINLGKQSLEDLQKLLDQGKLDDQTTKLVQSLIDLNQQFIDTTNILHEELLGIDFSSIEDGIISLFQNATTTTEDFGKNFTSIIQKSLINGFKRDILEKQLQSFYDDFYAKASSDSSLSQAEIQQLRDEYNKIITDSQQKFIDLQKATGIDLTTDGTDINTTNTLSNAIKGITTDQADLLAGQFGGLRLAQLETNRLILSGQETGFEFAKTKIDILNKIELNTRLTAENTDGLMLSLLAANNSLAAISTNTKSVNDTLIANGKIK